MRARIPYNLNKYQKKEMEKEINAQIAEADAKYCAEVDAVVLFTLMVEEGWGKRKLRRFWEAMYKNHQEMLKRYEMNDDYPWICTKFLMDRGIDVKEWNREIQNSSSRA